MHEARIESLANPLVKELRALRTPKGRDEQRRFLAEGAWMLDAAASAGWRPRLLLVDTSTDLRMQALTHGIMRDRKSTRLNSSHVKRSRMPSSA